MLRKLNSFFAVFIIPSLLFNLIVSSNFYLFNKPQKEDETPTCISRTHIPNDELPWLYLPQSSEELKTSIPLTILAGELIKNKVVDASSCFDGGLLSNGAASACGLDLALPLVYELQNVYNDEIVYAGYQIGTPPVMLKQLFKQESQFWPGRYDAIHFGLGHLTTWGASTALLWNRDLLQEVCQTAFGQPCYFYIQTSNVNSDLLVGTLIDMVNADCENCPYKIDVPKAEASVQIFAQVLMAHCNQTAQVVYNITGKHSSNSVSYAAIWRMALFNYNVGPICLEKTLNSIRKDNPDQKEFTWDDFEDHVPKGTCQMGLDYVKKITVPITENQ
jgi:hypothetical protein